MILPAVVSKDAQGCCGTTPEHIRHTAEAVSKLPTREILERPVAMRLSGLEPFELVA